jgi:hypothetical protein
MLNPENIMRWTKVLHCEFQQHFPSELGKLSDMSTEEQHIVHLEDEEDGTPNIEEDGTGNRPHPIEESRSIIRNRQTS